jgi:hypothetical protein
MAQSSAFSNSSLNSQSDRFFCRVKVQLLKETPMIYDPPKSKNEYPAAPARNAQTAARELGVSIRTLANIIDRMPRHFEICEWRGRRKRIFYDHHMSTIRDFLNAESQQWCARRSSVTPSSKSDHRRSRPSPSRDRRRADFYEQALKMARGGKALNGEIAPDDGGSTYA